MKHLIIIGLFSLATVFTAQAQDYYIYVTAESEDEVSLLKFDGEKISEAKNIPVGIWPAEIEGPHGINVSPEGRYWYLSLAHGNPYGTLYKFDTETNKIVGQVELGLFPATMSISAANGFLFCVNFNLHGDMVPSSVSVVDPESMTELKKIETGTMPHGSRMTSDGMYNYSVAMMSGELFEIDAFKLEVSRILDLDKNEAVPVQKPEMAAMDHATMDHSTMDHSQMNHDTKEKSKDNKESDMDHSQMEHSTMDHAAMGHTGMKHSKVKPTWAIPHPTKPLIYVAGNGSNEILEVNREKWTITRRFDGGKAPYNVEITPDGKLFVVTYKGEGTTGIWDIKKGKEIARLKNSTKVSHGVAISSDSRYAFISVEGIGGEPGRVDVIDLKKKRVVDTAEIGKQAGGIIFWKKTETKP